MASSHVHLNLEVQSEILWGPITYFQKFDFKFDSVFAIVSVAYNITIHSESGQNWLKTNSEKLFSDVRKDFTPATISKCSFRPSMTLDAEIHFRRRPATSGENFINILRENFSYKSALYSFS